ncbi:MAG: hypothetical protein WCK98_04970 [bacterium]
MTENNAFPRVQRIELSNRQPIAKDQEAVQNFSPKNNFQDIGGVVEGFTKQIPGMKYFQTILGGKPVDPYLKDNRIFIDRDSEADMLGVQLKSEVFLDADSNNKYNYGKKTNTEIKTTSEISQNDVPKFWTYLTQSIDQKKVDTIYSDVQKKMRNWLIKDKIITNNTEINWPPLSVYKINDDMSGGHDAISHNIVISRDALKYFHQAKVIETLIHEALHSISAIRIVKTSIGGETVKQNFIEGLSYSSKKLNLTAGLNPKLNTSIDEAVIEKTTAQIMKAMYPKEYKIMSDQNAFTYPDEIEVVQYLTEKIIAKTNGKYSQEQLDKRLRYAQIKGIAGSDVKFIDRMLGEGTARLINNFRVDKNAHTLLNYFKKTDAINSPQYRFVHKDLEPRTIWQQIRGYFSNKAENVKVGDYVLNIFHPTWKMFPSDRIDSHFMETTFGEMEKDKTKIQISGLDKDGLPDINIRSFEVPNEGRSLGNSRKINVQNMLDPENGLKEVDVKLDKTGLPNPNKDKFEQCANINTMFSKYRDYFNQKWAKNELLGRFDKEKEQFGNKETTIDELYKSINYVVSLENTKRKVIDLYNTNPEGALAFVKGWAEYSNGKTYLVKPVFKTDFDMSLLNPEPGKKIQLNMLLEALNFPT